MTNATPQNNGRSEAGVVLLSVMIVGLILALIVAAFMEAAGNAMHAVKMWKQTDQAFTVAISAMERAKWDIHQKFVQEFHSTPYPQSSEKFDWFEEYGDAWVGQNNTYNAPQGESFEGATVTVTVKNTQRVDKAIVDVLLEASAEIDHSRRTVQELVRYKLGGANVFDYAYFVNNFGWLWGGSITAHGDVRANANFSCRYGPDINGNAYAAANSDFGASGEVDGSWDHWSMGTYYSNAPEQARPGDPPSSGYDGAWPMGYDDNPREYEAVPVLPMPYLGDLTWYEALAQKYKGSLSQKNVKIVDEVYDGPGPDGAVGTADDGMLVLEGTAAQPLEIDGPVVIRGDVAIKGYITGQGTIYAGRNIHIAGELTYVDPPSWSKPDSHPNDTVIDNADKDMLGLAAKGNIILGDYTDSGWYNRVDNYMQPNFTNAYDTDPSDYANGYDSDWDAGTGYRFNGDYTAKDGGQRIDAGGNTTDRRYFQSSNDQAFAALAPTNDIHKVDAVCYTNHLFGGSTAEMNFNGAIVARDEAIIFRDYVKMTWDIRLGSPLYDNVKVNFALPQTLRVPETMYWREM